jgi:hypothetical protein
MNPVDLYGANFATTLSGITGVDGATTLTTANATTYCINGKAYSKAAATGGTAPTLDSATGLAFKPVPPGYGCVFAITLIAGTDVAFGAVQGEIVPLNANADTYVPGGFIAASEFPTLPDTVCAIGYLLIQVCTNFSVATGWLLGTHNTKEAAYNSTAKAFLPTPVSCLTLPARPQSA